jgi:hypothetical protein
MSVCMTRMHSLSDTHAQSEDLSFGVLNPTVSLCRQHYQILYREDSTLRQLASSCVNYVIAHKTIIIRATPCQGKSVKNKRGVRPAGFGSVTSFQGGIHPQVISELAAGTTVVRDCTMLLVCNGFNGFARAIPAIRGKPSMQGGGHSIGHN